MAAPTIKTRHGIDYNVCRTLDAAYKNIIISVKPFQAAAVVRLVWRFQYSSAAD